MLERAREWLSWRMLPAGMKQLADDDMSGSFMQNILEGSRFSGASSPAGTKELLDAYTKMPWLRAVVHKVSLAVGMTTWTLHVAKGRADGKAARIMKFQYGTQEVRHRLMKQAADSVEIEEIVDHPLLALLNSGSTTHPGTTNMRMAQMYIDLVGEGVQLKERGALANERSQKNTVIGLVNIPPHWVRKLPTPGDPNYSIGFGRTGKVEEVPAEDVIFYRDPNPLDPFGRGAGMARVLSDELQANEAASRTIRARLENNAIPPFIAMPEKGADAPGRPQMERVREDWQRRLRGPSKSGFVHFLMARFKFEKMGNTFEELSLIPLLKNQRDTIIQVYGVPPEILGILESSNRATVEAAEFLFGKFVILPRLEFLRAVLQQLLVPEFDDRLILGFESPINEDKEHELKVMEAGAWAFKANELRKRAGEPSLGDEGEVFAVPTNIFLEQSLVGAAVDDDDDSSGTEDASSGGTVVSITDRSAGGPLPKDTVGLINELVTKSHEDDADEVANGGTKQEDLRKGTEGTVRDAVREAGERRLAELGIDIAFEISDPRVLEILAKYAGEQIKRINDTTLKALREALTEGFRNGEDINLLARRIRTVFADARGRRSVVIARTESTRALNAGQLAATEQAGFEGKQWLSTRDTSVRETHMGLDGQIRKVKEDFVSISGAVGPYPGAFGVAAEDIQCRCTVLSVAKVDTSADDIVWAQGLDTEERRLKYWKANERFRIAVEKRLRRAFRRVFTIQEEKTLDFLVQHQGRVGLSVSNN